MRSFLSFSVFLFCTCVLMDGAFAQGSDPFSTQRRFDHRPPAKAYDERAGERIMQETDTTIYSQLEDGTYLYREFIAETGRLIECSTYADADMNRREGSYNSWWYNGQPRAEGQYANNQANGFWMYFDSAGTLVSEGEMIDNQREGTWSFYLPDGQLFSSRNYVIGEEVGKATYYNATGDIVPDYIPPAEPVFLPEEMPYIASCRDVTGDERKACHNREILKFIYKNITYPQKARESRIEGTAVVQLVIDEDGTVIESKVIRAPSEDTAAECLRVVAKMPRWMPGRDAGMLVRSKYNLPIRFKLE